MLTHAQLIVEFVDGIDETTFTSDVMRQLAVIRSLEIIGEASRRLALATRASVPHVAWQDWIDFRNRLSHAYDDIRMDIVWSTVSEELPTLITDIEDVLSHKLPGE
jgi:uncharacterized protein with HEPN domain